MPQNTTKYDLFTAAYIDAALGDWECSLEDLAPETLEALVEDAVAYREVHAKLLASASQAYGFTEAMAGYDFYASRQDLSAFPAFEVYFDLQLLGAALRECASQFPKLEIGRGDDGLIRIRRQSYQRQYQAGMRDCCASSHTLSARFRRCMAADGSLIFPAPEEITDEEVARAAFIGWRMHDEIVEYEPILRADGLEEAMQEIVPVSVAELSARLSSGLLHPDAVGSTPWEAACEADPTLRVWEHLSTDELTPLRKRVQEAITALDDWTEPGALTTEGGRQFLYRFADATRLWWNRPPPDWEDVEYELTISHDEMLRNEARRLGYPHAFGVGDLVLALRLIWYTEEAGFVDDE